MTQKKSIKRTPHWSFSVVKTRPRKTNKTASKSGLRVKILIMKLIENNILEGNLTVFF